MKKITGKMKLNEILEEKPEVAEILFEAGLSCFGCPMAMEETLEQGCLAHDMTKKQINELVEKLNREK